MIYGNYCFYSSTEGYVTIFHKGVNNHWYWYGIADPLQLPYEADIYVKKYPHNLRSFEYVLSMIHKIDISTTRRKEILKDILTHIANNP